MTTPPGLLVRRRLDGDLRFEWLGPVRVGSDPAVEVPTEDPAVSPVHGVLEPRPDGWWYVDQSTTGSYVEGERVSAVKVEDEPILISLGHPTAGYEIEVIRVLAPEEAVAEVGRKKRRRMAGVLGVALVSLVVVGGGVAGIVAVLDDDDPAASVPAAGLSDAELDRAKAASVLLQAVDASGLVLYSGSGAIISDDGLILTNAHVGAPNAPGQSGDGDEPDYLLVSLTSTDDDLPASAAYRARPIVADGYLDLAVLQIESDADGAPIDPDDLDLPTPLPLGDSDDLRTGDRIVALGYPAIGNVLVDGDRPLTVTEGVVSTFQADPIIGTERGSIDSDVRLGSGNSGGPSINDDGEIVGLNTRVITAASVDAGAITQGSALIVPINLASTIVEIAEDGGDPDYVSPFLESLPETPSQAESQVTSAGWVKAGQEGACERSSSLAKPDTVTGVAVGDTLYAEFLVGGVPTGLPFSIDFFADDGTTRYDTISGSWEPFGEITCIWAPFTVPDVIPAVNAVIFLGDDPTPVVENPTFLE